MIGCKTQISTKPVKRTFSKTSMISTFKYVNDVTHYESTCIITIFRTHVGNIDTYKVTHGNDLLP